MSSSSSSNRAGAAKPLVPAHWIPRIAQANAAISILPICVGLYGVWNPRFALTALEFPSPTSAHDATVIEGLTRMYAVRQFMVGAVSVGSYYFGAYRLMGVMSLATGIAVAGVDAVVAKMVTGKDVWGHWIGVVMATGFGVTLAFS